MSSALLLRTSLLTLLLCPFRLSLHVFAQSQVTGDLPLAAPYGTPPNLSNESISRTLKQSAVYIPGYNLSAPEGFGPSGNGSSVIGWQLGMAFADNVPLKEAAAPDVNTDQVIDATALWLKAPEGVSHLNATAWKLCATVFPFVNMSVVGRVRSDDEASTAGKGRHNDGNCSPWLTDECTTALDEAGLAFGITADGSCYNFNVPASCLPYFLHGKGNGITIPLYERTLADGRFYAWGSIPTYRYDNAALAAALSHVWPVLLTWIQFGPSRRVFSANTHVSCVVADGNGTGAATERGMIPSTRPASYVACWLPRQVTWMLAALSPIVFVLLT